MKRALQLAIIASLLCACGSTAHQVITATPRVVVVTSSPTPTPEMDTYWPTHGWRTASPESQGMDGDLLEDMQRLIEQRGYLIDSLTVIRNGYVVFDVYFPPFEPDSKHAIHSCTKSIMSTLIGIAIDEGAIQGVSQTMLSFFPERTIDNLDAAKQAITLGHLLSMSSGLDCRDSYLYNWRGLDQMRATDDWTQHVLDLPMAHEPGTHFEYCNGGSFLLSAILQQSTGMTALEFAQQHLFGPLGIEDVSWTTDPQGVNVGYGTMQLRPHDMAKIGYLFLQQGLWDGEQIVSAEWVETATQRHIAAGTLSDGYGYQWWVDANEYYMALGYGGQFIFVVPDRQLVVVFTSSLYDANFEVPERLLNEYIIPAASS